MSDKIELYLETLSALADGRLKIEEATTEEQAKRVAELRAEGAGDE